MTTLGSNSLMIKWLQRSRTIDWCLTLGLDGRRRPNISGSFNTTLSYLDDQGEKWGDTYVKIIGQHFDDYAHWNVVSRLLPISEQNYIPTFVPAPFTGRQFKDAANGVTGLIGEILVTTFLQKELKIAPLDMAHLNTDRKAPDFCLNIAPAVIGNLLMTAPQVRSFNENTSIASQLSSTVWREALPIECKSRRGGKGDRQVRKGLDQLLSYWRSIPSMAGYGIFAQIDVAPQTLLRLHFLSPQPSEIDNVRKIITGNVKGTDLPKLPKRPTVEQFQDMVGGRLLG